MKNSPKRKAFALANWKMAMTISESLAFVHEFLAAIGSLANSVDIVICPPYTALHALSRALTDTHIGLGAQNVHAAPGNSHTGEISAILLADAGCRWVMLGHWEIRRRTGENDVDLNKKMLAGLRAGLHPILLMGEEIHERDEAEASLESRLPIVFADCEPKQVAQGVIVYEPEWTIGANKPAPPDYIASSCAFIRNWIAQAFGKDVAQKMRIIYGGNVAPEHVENLLASPDLDGLGVGRKGLDPVAFSQIVQLIAATKGVIP
jgi:triosephosphate isomerase